jgi:hypothetical protein
MLSPVSSYTTTMDPSRSRKRLWTSFSASLVGTETSKIELQADTTPHAPSSDSMLYSSRPSFDSNPTRTRSFDDVRVLTSGNVTGRVRIPALHCTVLHTTISSEGSERSSADNCMSCGRNVSPKSDVMVTRHDISCFDVPFTVTTRGGLRNRIYRMGAFGVEFAKMRV